jgi:hypothetical protein
MIALRNLSIAALIAASSTSFAQPVSDEPTALDVASAAAPGDESGRTDSLDPGDGAVRRIARGALFVPRVAITVAFAPLESITWIVERYRVVDRAQRLFFNDAGTVGLFPTIELESGLGLTIGARFVHRNLLGSGERVDVRASGGGRFRQRYAMALRSGQYFGKRISIEAGAEYERRPDDAFYGIGNSDQIDAMAPIDPRGAGMATEARFRHRIARATGAFDARVAGDLHLRGDGSLADHDFGRTDHEWPIDARYQPQRLGGFEHGVRNGYGELELRWDSRRRAVAWEPLSRFSTGSLAAAFAGRVTSLDGGRDFWRYGVDLQQFLRLGPGPRAVALRAHGEAVTGPRDAIPFNELPRLGGKDVLRGYPLDRFRDRVAMAGAVDYQWDLARNLSASLFVDAGRVYESLHAARLTGLRVGYGVSVEFHTDRSFLARASLASSIDGGMFLNLALDPVFELDRRVGRR